MDDFPHLYIYLLVDILQSGAMNKFANPWDGREWNLAKVAESGVRREYVCLCMRMCVWTVLVDLEVGGYHFAVTCFF